VASGLPHTCPSGGTFGGLLFTLLPSPQSRWKSFIAGWSVQAFSLTGLLFWGVQYHQNLILPEDDRVTNLVSYQPRVLHEEQQPFVPPAVTRPRAQVESKPVLETMPAVAALVVTRQIRTIPEQKQSELDRPAPELKLESKMPAIPTAPPSKIVAIGTFSANSPLQPTVTKPAAAVQTAGFGDPNGIPSSEHHGVANVSAKGGFDLPIGSGRGIGSRGASPGVVMSSGFGNGAIDTLNSAGIHPKIASYQPGNGANVPVEITFKPKPNYTDEGRKQKINGEVRLEVLFRSDGQVHVIRVVQGLGYGLDEQAVKAAEQIKFKPALHEGQPIDSMAQVHIIFELIS
jgi:TonB family protein